MNISKTETAPGTLKIKIEGEIMDELSSRQFEEMIQEMSSEGYAGYNEVSLDMTEVPAINSRSLAKLVSAKRIFTKTEVHKNITNICTLCKLQL